MAKHKVEEAHARYVVTVNVHEAKTHFSRLLEQAHAGQEIILAKGGKPYARMVPLETPAPTRQPGQLKHLALDDAFFDALTEAELAAWQA
jgi:prevent-host-death family protein